MIKVIFTWWSKRVQCLNQSFTLRQVVVLGYILRFLMVSLLSQETVVIVVVVDLLFERIVLATVKTTMPQQVSHRPIKYQSRSWSQRGIQVNRSVTKRYTGQQITLFSQVTTQTNRDPNCDKILARSNQSENIGNSLTSRICFRV